MNFNNYNSLLYFDDKRYYKIKLNQFTYSLNLQTDISNIFNDDLNVISQCIQKLLNTLDNKDIINIKQSNNNAITENIIFKTKSNLSTTAILLLCNMNEKIITAHKHIYSNFTLLTQCKYYITYLLNQPILLSLTNPIYQKFIAVIRSSLEMINYSLYAVYLIVKDLYNIMATLMSKDNKNLELSKHKFNYIDNKLLDCIIHKILFCLKIGNELLSYVKINPYLQEFKRKISCIKEKQVSFNQLDMID